MTDSLEEFFTEALAAFPAGEAKHCNKCSTWRPIEDFYLRRDRSQGDRFGRVSWCKHCGTSSYKAYYEKHREQLQVEGRARSYLSRHKGRITKEEAVKLASDKTNTCEICGIVGDMFIDHCHVTEKRRGFLCKACNSFIGLAQDSPAVLQKAIDYLLKYKEMP